LIERSALTTDDVTRVLHGWRAAGLAAETCNKRRTALLALFHALDGRGGSNPVRQAPKFRAPDPLPRGLAYDQIEKALAQLPRCKTKARLTLMAYTGMRPGQIMRLTPDDWDHRLHMITVPGTAKGRGTRHT
jgi:integrase